MVWLVGIGSLLVVATSTRNWNATGLLGRSFASTYQSIWISRVFSLLVVGLALIEIARHMRREWSASYERGTSLWLAFLLLFLAWVLSALFGTKPTFEHKVLYSVFIVTAVYMQVGVSVIEVVRAAKFVVGTILCVSLVVVPLNADMVIEEHYRGFLPALDFRLHGLTTHANSLGPLAVVYLLLEYWMPSKAFLRYISSAVAVVVLILAQSKTAWVAAIAVTLVLYVFIGRRAAVDSHIDAGISRQFAIVALPLLIVGLSGLVAVLVMPPLSEVGQFFEDRIPGLATLTGRDRIWEVTLREWESSPVFGYGPSLWDMEFRVTQGLFAGHAHNQFLQTLGEAGLVGLSALVLYMILLLYFAWRHAEESRGVTLALAVVLLVRCMTEAPFRLVVLLEPAFLTHLTLFAILTSMERGRSMRET
jgi:exopolysaccharide production protein ExoQ